jgi:hypothetical protein
VEVVVVVGKRDYDARRTLEPRVRAHEDHLGAGVDEAADEVLGPRSRACSSLVSGALGTSATRDACARFGSRSWS